MGIILKKMETDEEIKGKAYVHWKSWHEAYTGIVSQEYLDKLTLEKCEKMAFSWPDNIIVAKENGNVIGFVCYGDRGEEAPDIGEIFALYVLPDYYGKGVGRMGRGETETSARQTFGKMQQALEIFVETRSKSLKIRFADMRRELVGAKHHHAQSQENPPRAFSVLLRRPIY